MFWFILEYIVSPELLLAPDNVFVLIRAFIFYYLEKLLVLLSIAEI